MCYARCPYENYDGECTAGKVIPADAFCRDDFNDNEDETIEDFTHD